MFWFIAEVDVVWCDGLDWFTGRPRFNSTAMSEGAVRVRKAHVSIKRARMFIVGVRKRLYYVYYLNYVQYEGVVGWWG